MAEVPGRGVPDDRLCWLAVRKHCERRSRKLGVFGWLSVVESGRYYTRGGAAKGNDYADKLGDYGFATEDAAQTLSPAERAHLRATGEVPDWFLDDVERRYAAMRKHR